MKKQRYFSPLAFAAVTALFFAGCFGALYLPKVTASGVRSGVDVCLGTLLPSLYPFMFLSAFAAEYGISERAGRALSPVTRRLFYLPGEAGVTVALSFVGGYPVGAVGTAALLRRGRITRAQAARMLCFCVNPGPSFLISAVGDALYGSRTVGLLLFCAQTASSLIIGITLGIFSRAADKRHGVAHGHAGIVRRSDVQATQRDFSSSFVLAAKDACSSAVTLSALVVTFSAFSALLLYALNLGSDSLPAAALRCVLEVTDGTAALRSLRLPLWTAALAVGWGGLCVHFQVYASLSDGVTFPPPLRFTAARTAAGALSAAITYALTRHFGTALGVFGGGEAITPQPSPTTIPGSAALLLCCVMFVVFIGEEIEIKNSRCKIQNT